MRHPVLIHNRNLRVHTCIERDSGGHFHLTRFSALYAVPAAVLTSGSPAAAGGGGGDDAHSGQIAKTRQKLHSKNSWNWVVILLSATIWQVLNVKCIKTENGNDVNQTKIVLKNSWNHIKWTYFWRILPFETTVHRSVTSLSGQDIHQLPKSPLKSPQTSG